MLSLGNRIGRSRPRANQPGQPTRPLRPEEIEVLRRTVQPSAPFHPARSRVLGLTVVILILGLGAMVLPLILQRLILD